MLGNFGKHWHIGRAIYGKRTWRETRRTFLHTMRSCRHDSTVTEFENFFKSYTPDPTMLQKHPSLYELMSRMFLIKNSTPQWRLEAIRQHFTILQDVFTDEAIQLMYVDESKFDYFDKKRGITLWKSDELDMSAHLYYEPGQRKEGFLTVMLLLEDKGVYHANIRFAKGPNGERTLVIGTIQGYKDGLDRAKKITKKMYGYRPKNFITFLIREIGRAAQVESILAVSDEGFYANSHMVRGHKSKVAVLDTLWEDIGGSVMESDPNYYVIPLEEERKPIEEIKSQKRSQYRNRYALLDEYESMIQENIKPYIKA